MDGSIKRQYNHNHLANWVKLAYQKVEKYYIVIYLKNKKESDPSL